MEISFLRTDNLPFSLWFVSESHTLKVKPFDGALWRKKMCDTFIKTLNFYLNHLNTKKGTLVEEFMVGVKKASNIWSLKLTETKWSWCLDMITNNYIANYLCGGNVSFRNDSWNEWKTNVYIWSACQCNCTYLFIVASNHFSKWNLKREIKVKIIVGNKWIYCWENREVIQ